jgi:hypothetical protein
MGHIVKFIKLQEYLLEKKIVVLKKKKKKKIVGVAEPPLWTTWGGRPPPFGLGVASRPNGGGSGWFGHPQKWS